MRHNYLFKVIYVSDLEDICLKEPLKTTIEIENDRSIEHAFKLALHRALKEKPMCNLQSIELISII